MLLAGRKQVTDARRRDRGARCGWAEVMRLSIRGLPVSLLLVSLPRLLAGQAVETGFLNTLPGSLRFADLCVLFRLSRLRIFPRGPVSPKGMSLEVAISRLSSSRVRS